MNKPLYKEPPCGWVGFTLVELSIVLVIVALLVASVFVGSSLVDAARMRKLAKQFEEIDVSVATFKLKYACLPGDCINATNFFSGTNNGDGNSYLNSQSSVSETNSQRREHFKLWQHLALAGFLAGTYTGIGGAGSSNTHAVIGSNVPATPIAGTGITFWNHAGFTSTWNTYFGSTRNININIGYVGAERSPYGTDYGVITSQRARSLDEKIDDGLANSGKFGVYFGYAPMGTVGCTTGAAPNYSYGTNPNIVCTLLIFRNW